jgi:hypothetical protein
LQLDELEASSREDESAAAKTIADGTPARSFTREKPGVDAGPRRIGCRGCYLRTWKPARRGGHRYERTARVSPSRLIAIQNTSISTEGKFHANNKLNKMSDAPARLSDGNRQSVDRSYPRWFRK